MNDLHFDELAVRFAEKIYGSNKGAIRLAVLQTDIKESVPAHQLSILDIGAGLGHMALWLAQQGHTVTLVEPSTPMLQQAQLNFQAAGYKAEFIHSDWQHFLAQAEQRYDLILCHAVLEWLANPLELTQALRNHLNSDGWLSLAFYNKDALILQNLIKGNLRKLKKQRFSGDQGGLTPQQPLDPTLFATQLKQQGWSIEKRSGIRVFHDYMRPEFRAKIAEDELIKTELEFRNHPTLGPLGRYLHWMCQPNHETH